jgi:hypothetical protein
MSKSETQFLDFIKGAEAPKTDEDAPAETEVEVYPDQTSDIEAAEEAVAFSDTAQESSKDVREGVARRLFPGVQKERGVVGNILPRGETNSIQLGGSEKVSFPRSQTLTEKTRGLLPQ